MSLEQPPSSSWQIDAQTATLNTETLVGKVELDHPHRGIHRLCYEKLSLPGWLLGIASGDIAINGKGATDGSWDLVDTYARGSDLVASYRSLAGGQVTRQVYWSVHQHANRQDPQQVPLMIDVVASVQTELLQSYPRVFVSTQLPCETLLFVSNHVVGREWVVGKESVVELEASTSASRKIETPGCVIYRLIDIPWSYVEMAHPTDFCSWHGFYVEDGLWQSVWDVETKFLEKGVIRRFQLRAALVPRKNDLQLAHQLFSKFAAKNPPLTV